MSALLLLQGDSLSPMPSNGTASVLAAVLTAMGGTTTQFGVQGVDVVVLTAVGAATSRRLLEVDERSRSTDDPSTNGRRLNQAAIPSLSAIGFLQTVPVQVVLFGQATGASAINVSLASASSSGLLAADMRQQGETVWHLLEMCAGRPQVLAHYSLHHRSVNLTSQHAELLAGFVPAFWLHNCCPIA